MSVSTLAYCSRLQIAPRRSAHVVGSVEQGVAVCCSNMIPRSGPGSQAVGFNSARTTIKLEHLNKRTNVRVNGSPSHLAEKQASSICSSLLCYCSPLSLWCLPSSSTRLRVGSFGELGRHGRFNTTLNSRNTPLPFGNRPLQEVLRLWDRSLLVRVDRVDCLTRSRLTSFQKPQ